MKIQGFLLDECPKFCKDTVTLKDEHDNATSYELARVKGNGCLLTVGKGNAQIDQIVFSEQDLRAIYMLIHVNKK